MTCIKISSHHFKTFSNAPTQDFRLHRRTYVWVHFGEGQLVQPPQAAETEQWQNGQQIEYFKLKKRKKERKKERRKESKKRRKESKKRRKEGKKERRKERKKERKKEGRKKGKEERKKERKKEKKERKKERRKERRKEERKERKKEGKKERRKERKKVFLNSQANQWIITHFLYFIISIDGSHCNYFLHCMHRCNVIFYLVLFNYVLNC
jgi:hypothetical protein